jgi:type III secretory pathway component EscV
MQLKKNVSVLDQIIRAMLILDFVVPCMLGLVPGFFVYVLISLSVILAISCLTGYCWVYGLLKISTREQINS